MGGKPHTSRGCNECRKRKVKCDEQMPYCMRCIKRGAKCSGPRKASDLTFISPYNAIIAKDFQPPSLAKPKKELAIKKQDNSVYRPLLPRLSPSQRINTEPMINTQLLSTYLGTYFPHPEISTSHRWPSIISNIMTLPQKGPILQHTCAALSRIYLGKVKGDKALLYDGLKRFNHAIRLFSNHLSRNSYTEEAVHAAVIFQEIKTYDCPESVIELFSHIEALNTIVQYHATNVLEDSALARTYMQHAKQRTLFWLFYQMTEDEIRFVQDSYDSTPLSGIIWGFSESARLGKVLDKLDPSDREGCQSLFSDCKALQTFLEQLYPLIETTGGNIPTYALGELQTGLPHTDFIFGPAYRFTSLDAARLHTFLWTALSLFYQVFPQCIQFAKAHHPDILPNSIDKTAWGSYGLQMAEFYSNESARCLVYCSKPGMGTEGMYYAPHCLFNIFRISTFTRKLLVLEWCDESFKFIAGLGNDAADRLRQYMWDLWCGLDDTHVALPRLIKVELEFTEGLESEVD